jgi:hypothetical protein
MTDKRFQSKMAAWEKYVKKLYIWRVLSSGIQRHVVYWKSTNVLGKHAVPIFGFEE